MNQPYLNNYHVRLGQHDFFTSSTPLLTSEIRDGWSTNSKECVLGFFCETSCMNPQKMHLSACGNVLMSAVSDFKKYNTFPNNYRKQQMEFSNTAYIGLLLLAGPMYKLTRSVF